jgi:ABC-type thiamin/hydroxymethylpyrimidine transport system permease subunit
VAGTGSVAESQDCPDGPAAIPRGSGVNEKMREFVAGLWFLAGVICGVIVLVGDNGLYQAIALVVGVIMFIGAFRISR